MEQYGEGGGISQYGGGGGGGGCKAGGANGICAGEIPRAKVTCA